MKMRLGMSLFVREMGQIWRLSAAVFALAACLSGQTYQGGLRGAVRDPAGAVIPGVELVLTNEETNSSRASQTNAAGEYAFSNVFPGNYALMVSKSGFKKFESKGIHIGTQIFITLDVTLQIGRVSESVLVTGEAPVIENSNASLGSTLEKKDLERLPTPARNVFYLAITTPNVIPSGDPQFVRQQDQTNSSLLSLGGGPRRANNYTVDGVPITDLRNRAVFIPNIEAVEEVKVQVSTYDAEMGRTGGGVFNVTGKSGGNNWHGSGMYQNRPQPAQANLYFSKGRPKPDTFYHLYSGSFGGPVRKDRTFFWATTEGYKTATPRNASLILPTDRELSGDFSQSGINIFDPLTTRPDPANPGRFIRTQFPGNVIPTARLNNVANAVKTYFPKPTSGKTASSTASLLDRATQATGKLDHRFSDRFNTSAMYSWYDSTEPESRFYGKNPGDNVADPAEGALYRSVHTVAVNNIWSRSNNNVFSFRYGYTQFQDDDVPIAFDPAKLGFSSNFIGAIPFKKFPIFSIAPYGSTNFDTFGDRAPQETLYYSHGVNASMSKLVGRHTLKAGGDWRVIGMKLFARGQPSGRFTFNTGFTQGPDPQTPLPATGDSLASFLLGFPASGNITVGSPNNFFINYYAGYVHDDFRMRPNLTINVGLRYEFEQGLKERDNHMTVGFSRDKPFPVQVPGLNLKGGLLYAGVDGAPANQSEPSLTKYAPRVGFAWAASSKTVLRGGYGIFFSPNQYAFPNENRLGTRGFTAVTDYVATTGGGASAFTPCPACTLTNPFPNGIEQPVGSRLGLLTGAGGTVHFIDQFRKSAYVQQYSVDLQHELRNQIAVSVGYVGSRSENLVIGGTNSNTVNINQLDRQALSQGSALTTQVPNPMFGNAAFGVLGGQPTVQRGQLLRPYPQFGDVLGHQVSAGSARYHALVLKFKKRISRGWGADVNYTFSRNSDNLFGETNYFANNVAQALDNYNLGAEFSRGLLDAPHRLNIVPVYEFPWGRGKRWLNQGGVGDVLFGGWSIAAVASYQSGFPSGIVQNNNNSGLFGSFQRPNLKSGVNPATSGSINDRICGPNDNPLTCTKNWFNKAAWEAAPAYTLGNAPRTDTRVRSQFKKNWDIAFQKNQRLSEKITLQLRAEIINAFDDPNLLGPGIRFERADFGKITQVGGFPRLLQWSARVHF